MAVMTPNPLPGPFLEGQDVHFTFSPDIVSVAYTTDGTPPSISKYIAYDNLTPRNPFIAVTEDGRGPVVYDGGFPKIYNGSAPAAGSGFADFTGSYKYVYNVLKWIANKEKIATGNNKILILGDSNASMSESYSIKSTISNSFFTSLTRLCEAVGYVPTFKERSDYGAELDPTLAELEQYCCLFLLSSKFDKSYITQNAVNDIVTYRENGNGIYILTDHGPIIPDIATAAGNTAGFFATANKVAARFGAFFSGDYGRTPVNCGWLRENYGDHPLYNGILDSETVYAGASESRVVVTTANVFDPSLFPTIRVDKKGLNTIQVLGVTSTGELVTGRYVYIIQGDEFVFAKTVNPSTGLEETNVGQAYADLGGRATVSMWVDGSTLGTVWGEIKLNGKRIGELHYTQGVGSKTHWYAGKLENTPLNEGDVIQQSILIPFGYSKSIEVNRQEYPTKGIALPSVIAVGRTALHFTGVAKSVRSFYEKLKPTLPPSKSAQPVSVGENGMMFFGIFENKYQFEDIADTRIFRTTAEVTAAIAATAANPGPRFIDASTNRVYAYLNGAFRHIVGLTAQDFYGAPRIITNTTTGHKFRLELNGTISQL